MLGHVVYRKAQLQAAPARTPRRESSRAIPALPGPTGRILELQRSVGNQAVVTMLSQTAPPEQMTVGEIPRRLGTGRPVEGESRRSIEADTGSDFSSVRVHTGAAADELCRTFDARAFTLGTDIVMADGEDSLGTAEGERLLAHELTHVVQQGVRSPPPAQRLEVGAVNDPAEREAKAVAERVATSGAERGPGLAIGAAPAGTVQRIPRPIPAGAPIFELNIDPEPIIWQLRLLSIQSHDTGVVDWGTHPLSQEIKQTCGGNYFRGSRYYQSGWYDDGFNDILDFGLLDTDIMVELTLMVDNLRPVTSGEAEFKSGGEAEARTKTSEETTVSGDISGKVGGEKGPGAEGKIGLEHKTGREREMSVKGAGDVTMKIGANVYLADAYIEVILNYDPTLGSKGRLGPKRVMVGTVTFGAPINTPAKAGAAAGAE
jgi:hypothetical protein